MCRCSCVCGSDSDTGSAIDASGVGGSGVGRTQVVLVRVRNKITKSPKNDRVELLGQFFKGSCAGSLLLLQLSLFCL